MHSLPEYVRCPGRIYHFAVQWSNNIYDMNLIICNPDQISMNRRNLDYFFGILSPSTQGAPAFVIRRLRASKSILF